jgi:uncharacterized protein
MRHRKCAWFSITFIMFWILFIGLAGVTEAAETPLPEIREYATDMAGILQEDERLQINQMLYQYAQATGNQILVVTIPTLGGEEIQDYAIRLAEKVQPGEEKKDNGAILLIARDERKIRIEVGYGLEAYLPDGRCGAIIRKVIRPAFQQGDFSGGIRGGLAAMVKFVTPDYQFDDNMEYIPQQDERESGGVGEWILPLIIALIIMGFGGFTQGRRRSRWYRGGFGSSGPTFWGGGWGSGSGGGFSDGGGGFSGGGGDFGGGGASGDW